jgi:hypothetical protein
MSDLDIVDPFAHLKRRARERSDRTVDRVQAGIRALQAAGQKITSESLKTITCELEPGFSGVSFQVIRRNERAYDLYRQTAAAFAERSKFETGARSRTRRWKHSRRAPHDPLQRLEKRELVRRVRDLELELRSEREQRGRLGYDEQLLRAKILRLDTEIILLRSDPGNMSDAVAELAGLHSENSAPLLMINLRAFVIYAIPGIEDDQGIALIAGLSAASIVLLLGLWRDHGILEAPCLPCAS